MTEGANGLGRTVRVVVEFVEGKGVSVNGNLPPEGCINLLTQGIVVVAQQMVRDESKSLVKPVGAGTVLRRLEP